MATATANFHVIKEKDGVTLVLSQDEAVFLRSMLRYVSGCPMTSPRKHADNIRMALKDAEIPYKNYNIKVYEDSLYFPRPSNINA